MNTSEAQKEAYVWYFGNHSGLDFNSNGSPAIISSSSMNTLEGCSSIADSNGNLLFYTDGTTVWNKKDSVMANGDSLQSNSFGTYSSQVLIVPQPNKPELYFIFTVDDQADTFGFRYSVVDISQDSGLGAITLKNVPLLYPSCEKITAVKKDDNTVWIASHQWNSNSFYCYTLDSSGLGLPVISSAGTIENGGVANTIGYMKFSPDGKRIALAIDWGLQLVELFDFDKSTGVISHPLTLMNGVNASGPYGIEFSPNSQVLYASDEYGIPHSHVYQWNLQAGSDSDIVNSLQTFGSLNNAAALQLGPDSKIYLAEPFGSFIGVINNPNIVGSGCNFNSTAINISPNQIQYGLPGFVQSYFYPGFEFKSGCYHDSICFNINNPWEIDSVQWNFGDTLSGFTNFSYDLAPCHTFSLPGNYNVELIKCTTTGCDTTIQTILLQGPYATISYTGDLTSITPIYFYGNSINTVFWNWDFGDSISSSLENPIHTYSQPGEYNVELTVNDSSGCAFTTEITIDIIPTSASVIDNDFSISIYSNPTSPNIHVHYDLPVATVINLQLNNILGNSLWHMNNLNQDSGDHDIIIDLHSFINGFYILNFQGDYAIVSRKIIVNH